MSLFYLLLVAIIQGITEFLPISSSGHLILLPALTGFEDQGLAIDVAVHVGTLVAVIIYFWRDVGRALFGTGQILRGQTESAEAQLALALAIATIPALIVGGLIAVTDANELLRDPAIVGWTMIGFGIVLYIVDRACPTHKTETAWGFRDAIWMGVAQCLALIPGTSRAGITITAGRFLGYDRRSAATVSMLMSIPIIIASGAVLALDVVGDADWALAQDALIAATFAGLAAWAALALMFRFLNAVSFTPYVIYRVLFGAGLLIWVYS